jgi:hypothetical protein
MNTSTVMSKTTVPLTVFYQDSHDIQTDICIKLVKKFLKPFQFSGKSFLNQLSKEFVNIGQYKQGS